jgi:hypothetical protein
VADLCTVKATFAHPPQITTDVKAAATAGAAA